MTWRTAPLAWLLTCAIASQTLSAQSGSCRVTVRVLGRDSLPLAGAVVSINDASIPTDASGLARIGGLTGGMMSLLIRRVGFQPFRGVTNAACDASAPAATDVRLAQIQSLAPVTVRADEHPKFVGPMSAFWERRARGEGYFFTTADIDRRNTPHLTELIRTVPGWGRSQQTDRFSEALTRGTAIRMGAAPRDAVRTAAQRCFPTVIIDGMAATMAELNTDGIDTRGLAGVEVYVDASRTPSEFWGTGGQGGCGVVAIWSRSLVNMNHSPLAQQSAPMDSVFEAHEVDDVAMLDSTANHPFVYPREMLRRHVSGDATVSLVVLRTGEPLARSLRITQATFPEFGAALLDAATALRFLPARMSGNPVAQRTEITVHFVHSPRDP
jgi:TonB family protein